MKAKKSKNGRKRDKNATKANKRKKENNKAVFLAREKCDIIKVAKRRSILKTYCDDHCQMPKNMV